MITSRRKKTISLFLILLLVLFFSLLISNHVSNGDLRYTAEMSNPFFDIFYAYYRDDKSTAKEKLQNLLTNAQYGKEAFINYGLVMQLEENISEAEEYYHKSLNSGELLALIYLFSLYHNTSNGQYQELLDSISKKRTSPWVEYEKGVHYLKIGKQEIALKHLERAVEMGFCSRTLLDKESVFDPIRSTKEFTSLRKKVIQNRATYVSLQKRLKRDEYSYYKNKSYGVCPTIRAALYFEKRRRYNKSEKLLLSQIKPSLPFSNRSIALLLLSRIKSKKGDKKSAKKNLKKFIAHLNSEDRDMTGYKFLMQQFYKDIIMNDNHLRTLY